MNQNKEIEFINYRLKECSEKINEIKNQLESSSISEDRRFSLRARLSGITLAENKWKENLRIITRKRKLE